MRKIHLILDQKVGLDRISSLLNLHKVQSRPYMLLLKVSFPVVDLRRLLGQTNRLQLSEGGQIGLYNTFK